MGTALFVGAHPQVQTGGHISVQSVEGGNGHRLLGVPVIRTREGYGGCRGKRESLCCRISFLQAAVNLSHYGGTRIILSEMDIQEKDD